MLPQKFLTAFAIFIEISAQDNHFNKFTPIIGNFLISLRQPTQINFLKCDDTRNSIESFKNFVIKHQIAMIRDLKLPKGYSEHQVFLLNLACENSHQILQKADDLKLFQKPYKWVLFGPQINLESFHFFLDSSIFFIDYNNVSKEATIRMLYKTHKDSHLIEDNWSFDIRKSERINVMGAIIRICIVMTDNDTLNHLTDYRNLRVDAITKANYVVVDHLMDFLNATKKLIFHDSWGYKNLSSGIYSGLVGDLQLDKADLGGTPLFFTPDRLEVIEYFAATNPTFLRFIFKAPSLSYAANVFTLPFATKVWQFSFLMTGVVVISIYLIVFWEWKNKSFRVQYLKNDSGALKPNLLDVIMLQIGAVTQQGSDVQPKSLAGKIATIFSFISLMFLYTSYSANIVALLQSSSNSIKTLQDLLDSRISLGAEDIIYNRYYFENQQDPIRKAIYEQKIAPKGQKPNFMSAEEGMRQVQNSFFAFHTELNTGYKIISSIFHENEKCSLREITFVDVIEPWMSMQKKSVYQEAMKIGMRKIRESGIQGREFTKVYSKKPTCSSGGHNFTSVGLIDCYFAFLLFICGVVFAIAMLFLEISIKKHFTCKKIIKC